MKTKSLLVLCIIIMRISLTAQVKIGDNSTTLNSASLLELETTDKGFVLPRVSITNVNASTPLAAGLLTGTIVYNTNSGTAGGSGAGIYYWDGVKWNFIANTTITGTYWSLTGNSGTNPSSNFIGSTDAKDFVLRTNNVERMRILGATVGSSQVGWIGMGVSTTPKSALDVAGNYAGKNVITIQNTSTTGFSSVDMLDNAGNLATTFGFANSGTGTAFSGKAYLNGYGNDFLFTRGSSYDLIMKGSNGYIGLNTGTPSERLHVVGNFYLAGAFMPGGNAGTSGYVLTSAGANTSPAWNNLNGLTWNLTGNSGTNAATNFIGTTDAIDFVTRTGNTERLRITSAGNVGIGLTNPSYKLAVLAVSNPLYLSGVQATGTLSADSVLTINAGVVKKTPFSSFATTTNTFSLSGNTLTSTVNGIAATSNAVSGVNNSSIANSLSTTVNGVTGSTVSIINSNAKTWTQAGGLTTSVNGVSSNVTPASGTVSNILGYSSTGVPVYQSASGILGGVTTNTLSLSGNTLTSTVNGIAATSNAVGGVSNTSSANTLSTTVNGITGSTVSIINSNAKTWTQAGGLTSTVNGVSSNITPASGAITNLLGYSSTGVPVYQSLNNINLSTAWNLSGNSSTTPANFLGTTDNVSMRFRTNNVQRMIIDSLGRVGIGLNNPSYAMSVLSASDPLYLSGVQATSTIATDSVLTINAGVVKKAAYASLDNSWDLTGNSGTSYATNFLGTKDNVSMRLRTNNLERMIIDSTGSVGIGSSSFNTANKEKLLVDYGTTTSHTLATLTGNVDDYFQINLQNKSSSPYASTDYVATADDGTESTYYIDMGINSSTYAPSVENWGGPHDAYLYASSRNLVMGTAGTNSDIMFLSGGGRSKFNTLLRMDGSTGNIIIGTGNNQTNPTGNIVRGPNGSGTNIAGGSLTLQGGSATNTATGGSLNLYGGGSATGALGAVNINSNTNSATNINTGTSGSNVTIGNSANNILLPKFNTTGGVFFTGASTGQIANTATNMTWDDANSRLGIGISNPGYKLSVLSSSNPLYLSGVQATTTFSSDSILTINAGIVKKTPYSSLPSGGSGWALTGNSGTNGTVNFLGTTDAQPLVIKSLSRQLAYFDGNLYSIALGFGAVNGSSDHNIAIGYNATTNNQYTLAIGYSATATGVRSVAIGNGASATTASGAESVAIGYNAISSADQTVSLGYQAKATGQYGVALGYSAQASASQSTAIGYSSLASAQYANAIGYQAQATGLQSTAIGYRAQTAQSNTILLGDVATPNLYVGIGTATPSAKLDIVGSSGNNPLEIAGLPAGVVGTDNVLTINSSGVVGYATPAAFGNGYWSTSGNAATSGNFLGTTNTTPLQFKFNSTLAGYLDANNTALGTSSAATAGLSNTAIGYSATASNSATAVGANAVASQLSNTAIGNSATANTSSQATAIGASSQALFQYNTAVGYNAQATSSSQETVIGASSQAQGQNNIAIGYSAKATASDKITVVGSNAQGSFQNNTVVGSSALATTNNQATAIGATAAAQAQNATALGYGASSTGINSTAIGAGAATSQNNAMILGTSTTNVGIGTSTPNTGTKLDVAGSFKLGTSGSVLSNIIKTTVAINPGIMAAGSTVTTTVTLTGAATGNSVIVNPRSALPTGVLIAYCYISAANTLTVVFTSAVAADPPNTTFDVSVIQ